MFNKVLWATDGSGPADLAMDYASALAKESGGELLVAHCEEMTLPGKGGGTYSVHADETELRAKIEQQVAELSNNGGSAKLLVSRSPVGGAAHAIAETAEAHGADVIVLGTRGHTALGGLIVGSVTQRLLHIASCPVLAVPARGSRGAAG